MAVTGKFDADFDDFKNEVDASTDKLKKMEAQADAVGTAVDKALEPKGGATGAIDTLGGAITNVGTAAATTSTQLGDLAVASDAAAQGGVAVVSAAEMEAAGFETLQSVTAATVAELMTATGAIEVIGAAMIGWKVGRAVSDFLDLDRAIGNATATALGWGSAAGEAAGAATDTLAKATEAAGYSVTKLSEAITILNEKDLERLKTVLRAVADQQADRLFDSWHHEIEGLTAAGLIPQLTKDLDSQAFTLKQLSQWYQVSEGSLANFQRELSKQRADQKDSEQGELDFRKEVQKILKESDDEKNKQETLDAKVRELERNHLVEQSAGLLGLSKIQQETSQKDFENTVKQITAHEKLVATINDEIAAATRLNTARTLGPTQADPAGDAAGRRDLALAQIAKRQQEAPELDLSQLIVDAWLKFDEEVGARAPLAGKGGTPAVVNMNISGVWDPATVRQMTDKLSEELMKRTGADRYLPAR